MSTTLQINTALPGPDSHAPSSDVAHDEPRASLDDAAIYPPSSGSDGGTGSSDGQTKEPILGAPITPYHVLSIVPGFFIAILKFIDSRKRENLKVNALDFSWAILTILMCISCLSSITFIVNPPNDSPL